MFNKWNPPLERVWGILFSFFGVVFSGFPIVEVRVPRTKSTDNNPLSILESTAKKKHPYRAVRNSIHLTWVPLSTVTVQNQKYTDTVSSGMLKIGWSMYGESFCISSFLTCFRISPLVLSQCPVCAVALTRSPEQHLYTCSPEAPPTPCPVLECDPALSCHSVQTSYLFLYLSLCQGQISRESP